jgi:hypothetical protein
MKEEGLLARIITDHSLLIILEHDEDVQEVRNAAKVGVLVVSKTKIEQLKSMSFEQKIDELEKM